MQPPIPLSVFDEQQDAFQLIVTPKLPDGAKLSDEYTADNNLPTVNFEWTPTSAQANKIYTLKFKAKETATVLKLSSLPVTAKIRVWPAGNRDQSSVQKLVVSTSKWAGDSLSLKGKIILNKLLTATEKSAYLGRKDLTVSITQGKTGTGADINAAVPIQFDAKGNWTLTGIALPASPAFSCNLTVDFEGAKAARIISGAPKDCIK
jgi:hypothetical protein